MKCMAAAVAMILATAGSAQAQIIERVLVKVNGDILTQTELEERQTAAIFERFDALHTTSTLVSLRLYKIKSSSTPPCSLQQHAYMACPGSMRSRSLVTKLLARRAAPGPDSSSSPI